MTMIDYRRNWSIFIFIRGLNEITTCPVLSFNGFFKHLNWTVISDFEIIFPTFIIATNKIQGLIIFSNDKKISKSWQNYFKNYICTFQWKWFLNDDVLIHDENFEAIFMVFMNEWRWPWYWTVQNWFLLMMNTRNVTVFTLCISLDFQDTRF